MHTILAPIAFIDGAVWKDLSAAAMAHFLVVLGWEQGATRIRHGVGVHRDPLSFVGARAVLRLLIWLVIYS